MLDTNIVSDLVRNPAGKAARQVALVGSHGIAISIVTAAELRYGCAKRGSPRLLKQAEAVVGGLDILPLGEPVDVEYASIRADLEAAGQPIGPNDLLIAAHARALDVPLVTASEQEFRRIPTLKIEHWLA
jgi:tRNA(fMet)-specific endonuclease VapC